MQNSAIYVKRSLKINMLKIKKFRNVRDQYHYAGQYRVAAYSICSSEYSIPKEITMNCQYLKL